MTLKFTLFASLAVAASACASGSPEQQAQQGPTAGIDRSERLLAEGRKLKTEKGCAAAAPTLRVIASFGDGHEVARGIRMPYLQWSIGTDLLFEDLQDGAR